MGTINTKFKTDYLWWGGGAGRESDWGRDTGSFNYMY